MHYEILPKTKTSAIRRGYQTLKNNERFFKRLEEYLLRYISDLN